MIKTYKDFKIPKYWFLIMTIFFGLNAQAQSCDFTVNNSGATGGDTEFFLELDATGNIAVVTPGPGPINITGIATGANVTVLHLVYDSANPPTNVPPVVGDDPTAIVGCTNDLMGSGVILECLCEEDEISATYTPGGGDVLMYYLTDGSGTILDVNTTGNFGTDEVIGDYFIQALSYDSANPPTIIPAIGGNISDFSADGCFNPDFLSSACCAQKISCCDLDAILDLAATTCDGPNGNLIFEIDATMATGALSDDQGGTWTDNGGGSWTGLVTVTPGTMVTVTITDADTACEVIVEIDATYIKCDDVGGAVCTLEGTLSADPDDYTCNIDGTISTNIEIMGAAGTNVTVDGVLVGGDGSYLIDLTGETGTVVILDPDGFDNCQFDLVYDLTGVLPNTPPTIGPMTELLACPGVTFDPVEAMGSAGVTFVWYSDAALTMPISTGVTGPNNEFYTPGIVPMGTTTTVYVVASNAGGCESPETTVTFTTTSCGASGGSFN